MIPKISLLCPTRGRGNKLQSLCENLMDTCKSVRNWEIVFIWDTDDLITTQWLGYCRSAFAGMNMRVMCREHSDNLSEDYFNWAIRSGVARGRLYWVVGDDVRMMTGEWDRVVIDGVEEYYRDKPDRIGLCFARDLHPTDKSNIGYEWGCFPILTKETVECLGWFFPKEFVTWEADVIMAKIFHDPRVDRLWMLPGVVIDQISYHAYPDVPRDNMAQSMRTRHGNPLYKVMRLDYKQNLMEGDINRLAEGIRNGMAKTESV